MIFLLAFATLASLAAAAFFAGTETAFLSVGRERILHLARAGGRKARLVQKAISEMSRTTTTLLVGNNLASVAYSTATAALISDYCSDSLMRSVWSFLAALTVLYVSEFLPKLLCAARPLRRSLVLAPWYFRAAFCLKPVIDIAMFFTDMFIGGRRESGYKLTSADLLRILEDRKDGVCLTDLESALISRILVLRLKQKPITAEAILSVLRDAEV